MGSQAKPIQVRKGQSLIIGKIIKITVLGRKGGDVRIGIEAPRWVKVRRAELVPKDDNK